MIFIVIFKRHTNSKVDAFETVEAVKKQDVETIIRRSYPEAHDFLIKAEGEDVAT